MQNALKTGGNDKDGYYSDDLEAKWGGGNYSKYYSFYDVDGDGTRELLLFSPKDTGVIISMLTYENGAPKLLAEAGHSSRYIVTDMCIRWDGVIGFNTFDSTSGDEGACIVELENGNLKITQGYVKGTISGGDTIYFAMGPDYRADTSRTVSKEEVEEVDMVQHACGVGFIVSSMDYYR